MIRIHVTRRGRGRAPRSRIYRTKQDDRIDMKTLKQRDEPPETRPGPGDYYELSSRWGTWYVSPETAARIGRALDRPKPKTWLKFVDLSGSRAWVRAEAIQFVSESTEHQRTKDRVFRYLMRKEHKADRRWDEDDY